MAYFANGEEGRNFEAKWCSRCVHDIEDDCPLMMVHLLYNYEQLDKGQEKLRDALSNLINGDYDSEGVTCKMFHAIEPPKGNPLLHNPFHDFLVETGLVETGLVER